MHLSLKISLVFYINLLDLTSEFDLVMLWDGFQSLLLALLSLIDELCPASFYLCVDLKK